MLVDVGIEWFSPELELMMISFHISLFSYKDVIAACSLDDDFKLMPSGDLTEVHLYSFQCRIYFQYCSQLSSTNNWNSFLLLVLYIGLAG